MTLLSFSQTLSLGDVLDQTVRVFRRRFILLTSLMVTFAIVSLAIRIALAGNWRDPFSIDARPDFLTLLMQTVFASVTAIAIAAFIGWVVYQDTTGKPVQIWVGLRELVQHWRSLVILSTPILAEGLFTTSLYGGALAASQIGWFACLAGWSGPLVFVFLKAPFYFASISVAVENVGALTALGRTWRLVSRSLLRVCLILGAVRFLTFIIEWTSTFLFAFVSSFLSLPTSGLILFYTVGGSIVYILTQPLVLVCVAIVYVTLRVKYEGLDLEFHLQHLNARNP